MTTTEVSTVVDRTPSRLARGAVLGAASLTIMAAAIIAPSLPAMAARFAEVPAAEVLVRTALTITSLAIAVTAPLAGLLADRIGRRPLLVGGLALYTLAGVTGLLIDHLVPLLASRALLGIAVGAIMTAVGAIIADWFDGPRRAGFLALQQASASLGGVLFLPLAGLLAEVSWRLPFVLYGAGAAVLPLVIIALREPARPPTGSPLPGTGEPDPGAGWRTAGIYGLALVATIAFFMAPTQLPFALAAGGLPTALIGAVVAGSTATGVLGALAFPRLRPHLAAGRITGISLLLLGLGWLLVGSAGSVGPVIAGVLVGGVGVGLVVPNLNLRLTELAGPGSRGRLLGGLVAAIFLGQFLSPLAVQPFVAAAGIPAGFTWSGAALALAGLIAVALPSAARRPTDSGTTGSTTHH